MTYEHDVATDLEDEQDEATIYVEIEDEDQDEVWIVVGESVDAHDRLPTF